MSELGTDRGEQPEAELLVADVAEEPWSEGATVVVDVANLAGRVTDLLNERLTKGAGRSGAGPTAVEKHQLLPHTWRIVDLLAHHGIRTRRLLLALALTPFPAPSTGWAAVAPGANVVKAGRRLVEETQHRLAGREIVVEGLAGGFDGAHERGVDEAAVLGAAAASWDEGADGDVVVVTWDADVMVAPWLAGRRRILLATTVDSAARTDLGRRDRRHRARAAGLPPHVSLLRTALLGLMPADEVRNPALRAGLERIQAEPVPAVEMVRTGDGRVLRNSRNSKQVLSSDLDAPHDRSWFDERHDAIGPSVQAPPAVAVVDGYGVLRSANRSGIPGRVPDVRSVTRMLERLGIPGPVAQLAVVPDVIDEDRRRVAVDGEKVGRHLGEELRKRIARLLRRGVVALDVQGQRAIDSYRRDRRRDTIAAVSVFSRHALSHVGARGGRDDAGRWDHGADATALVEKETAVLLAADLLWTLSRTDRRVLVISDRPEMVAVLDLLRDMLPPEADVVGRVVRIGLHADPFTGDGLAVGRSGTVTPWPLVLLTRRLLADLLRIHDEPTVGPGAPDAPAIVDVLSYDPSTGLFHVHDDDGRRVGVTTIWDLVGLPEGDLLRGLGPADGAERSVAAAQAAEGRRTLARRLRLHLEMLRPLPRPRLGPAPEGRADEDRTEARATRARVIGHGEGTVVLEPDGLRGARPIVAAVPAAGLTPEYDRIVDIILEVDGETCVLDSPDLAGLGPEVGVPHPATVTTTGAEGTTVTLPGSASPVRCRPLLGPFPPVGIGDEVLVVVLEEGALVQQVATPGAAWWTPPIADPGATRSAEQRDPRADRGD